MSTIVGIDPGSNFLGLGIIKKTGNNSELLHVEVIRANPKHTFHDRLKAIQEKLGSALDRFHPQEAALEDLFYSKNIRSAFQLGVVKGVAISLCLQRGYKIFEYPPTKVKSIVTGFGHADKDQVKKMVELTLKIKLEMRHDASDALSLALCHAYTQRWEKMEAPRL